MKALVVFAATAIATPCSASPRWAVGLEATWLGVPKGHLGISPSNGAFPITPELVGRYELSAHLALDAGVGIPHAAMGASGFATLEVYAVAAGDERRTSLRLFGQAGPQLGYAGADYFARHFDSFVGYGYTTAGPLAFAARLPVGLGVSLVPAHIDTYLQVVPIITFTPRVEPLYDLALGVRATF